MDILTRVDIKFKDSTTAGQVTLVSHSPAERFKLSLKIFFYCLLAILVSVFIPILHFILVPLFALASIALPLYVYYKKTYIKGGTGTCPNCHGAINIKPTNNNWPIHEICKHCSQYLRINIQTP